ncbi:MAG: excisionase family DNA-binding protein [Planctomycetota bacterium]|jgi:excisionase family DNA binding protein
MTEVLLSTGQAARLCSVTSEAVLRWIKSGRLRALRTPGGHHRIPKAELERHQGLKVQRQFCWEYHGKGTELLDTCRRCIVYRSRTQRCWELARLGKAAEHSLRYCKTSCEDCDYFRLMQGRVAHVLVLSDDPRLLTRLRSEPPSAELELEFAETEYALSGLVESFRPEFVVIDGEFGATRVRGIARSLLRDPRARLEGIILAADADEPTEARGEGVLARIGRPFGVDQISECIRRIRAEHAG